MGKEKLKEKILIVCVDRDDDLGVKTGIKGPVLGKEANIEAASKLALADPTEADANAIFGAVKVYDEVRQLFPDSSTSVEVVTITGHPKSELLADEEIKRQIELVVDRFNPDSIILVSDGADDELVIPLLMRYAPIRSVRRVIVQQSREIEHTYILLKRYFEKLMKSPTSRALLFGLPGALLLLAGIFSVLELQRYLYIGALVVVGTIFLDKGFDLSDKLRRGVGYFGKQIGLLSFIMGIFGILISLFFSYSRATSLAAQNYPLELIMAKLFQEASGFIALSLVLMFAGSAIESLAVRKVDAFEKIMGAGLILSLWMSFYFIGQYMEGTIGLIRFLSMQMGALIFAISIFFITLRLGKVFRDRGWE